MSDFAFIGPTRIFPGEGEEDYTLVHDGQFWQKRPAKATPEEIRQREIDALRRCLDSIAFRETLVGQPDFNGKTASPHRQDEQRQELANERAFVEAKLAELGAPIDAPEKRRRRGR